MTIFKLSQKFLERPLNFRKFCPNLQTLDKGVFDLQGLNLNTQTQVTRTTGQKTSITQKIHRTKITNTFGTLEMTKSYQAHICTCRQM